MKSDEEKNSILETEHIDETSFGILMRSILAENGMSEYVSDKNLHKFYLLADYLRSENAKYNLTAVKDPEGIALLHIADSLTLASILPHNVTLLDVGAGGGFPSIPVAVARPDVRITSLDATAKKVRYIDSVADLLSLDNVTAVCGRAEDLCGGEFKGKFDYVTARAVSSLGMLCELCTPALKVGGFFAAMKGEKAAEELIGYEKAEKKLNIKFKTLIPLELSYSEEHLTRNILIFEKVRPTPPPYPRQYSRIKNDPLF